MSLLQSLIATASSDDVEKVWLKIVNEVQSWNPRAGVMTLDNLPQEILDYFRIKLPPQMPVITGTPIRETITAALLGSWDENAKGDQTVIEQFTGMAFGAWQDRIRDVWVNSQGVFEQRDGKWKVTDRRAIWDLEGPRITDPQLDRFKDVVVTVLREKDPALELVPDERFAASMYGKERIYSGRLRKGIAETLALLGVRSGSLSTCSNGKAEITALIAVREILTDGDWDLWASLSDVLPLLAEASPEAYLDAVDASIISEAKPFTKVFAQESSGFAGRTYITGLLWGLEALAWNSDHVVPVCRILSDLAAIDPGGNWTNRPSNSLTTILLPWLPQTCATTEKRHAAVRVVVKQHPEVGWNLVLSLLPETRLTSSGTHKPAWRFFIPEDWKDGVSPSQYWADVLVYSELALEMAGTNAERLVKLVERYFRLPGPSRDVLRQRLTSTETLGLAEADKFILWNVLTNLTTNHRRFGWEVPAGALEELDAIADQLRPTAPEIRNKRLFGGTESNLYDVVGDWEAKREKLYLQRQGAVSEIIAAGGLSFLLKFASEVEASWQLGFVFASLADIAQDVEILPSLLEMESKPLFHFAGGYVSGRHKSGGWNWVDSLKTVDWSSKAKGQFFAFLPFCKETWDRVQSIIGPEEGEYWRKASAFPYENSRGVEMALGKLIDYGRADEAIQYMNLMAGKKEINPDLTLRALDSLSDSHRIDAYAIGELITLLQGNPSVNEVLLRRVEWKLIRILGEFHNGKPISLSRWMAEDPDFFCEVIQTAFRSTKDQSKVEPSDELKERATNVYYLLKEWRIPPGARRDGSFDSSALASWVQTVKTKCIESGRWEVAASQIGEVLFYAPQDKSGLWIESVCEVLDEKDHDRLRKGLTIKVFNSRGVFTFTGGKQELEIAEEWEKKASVAEEKGFSRLGQELRRLASTYRRDAEREAKRNPLEPR